MEHQNIGAVFCLLSKF